MIIAQQVRRPLIGIALSMVTGLALYNFFGGSSLLWLGVAALFLATACRWSLSSRTNWLLYLICGVLAAAYGSIRHMPSPADTVLALSEVTSFEQELIGVIRDDPVTTDVDGTVSFLFKSTAVLYEQRIIPAQIPLKVYLKNASGPVRFGETWRLKGRYTAYAKPHGQATGFLSVLKDHATRLSPAPPSLMNSCYAVRQRAAEILRTGVTAFSGQVKLLQALLLGYRQAMPEELYRMFSRTGILHIFAISGLHVGVMAAILIASLKLIGIPRPRWGWLLIPALFLYVLSTGMKASALRAFTMAAVYFAAPLAGRRPDAPSAVALAAMVLLILEPANLNDPGFLLSFTVVCGILMMHGWLIRQIHGIRFSKWETPLKHLNGPHPAAALLRSASLLAVTSLAAWIFSVPITACFFNTLSIGALIGNPVVIPLTFMIMLTGSLTLLCGGWNVSVAAFFNLANVQFINLLLWIVRHLSDLSVTCRFVGAPSAMIIGFWYAGWVCIFTGPVRWRKGATLLILLSCLLWITERIRPNHHIRVLRDGDSAMALQLPDRRWIAISKGDSYSTTRTIRLLQKEGINRLDTLVITQNSGLCNAESIRQIEELFHPGQTVHQDKIRLSAEAGAIRILPDS